MRRAGQLASLAFDVSVVARGVEGKELVPSGAVAGLGCQLLHGVIHQNSGSWVCLTQQTGLCLS